MSDPHNDKDDAEIIIKPLMFTGTILLSAGAGLAAGLLICWLFCCDDNRADNRDDGRQTSAAAIDSSLDSARRTSYPRSSAETT